LSTDAAEIISIIGAGIIGLAFAALHLTENPSCSVTIFDTRPALQSYVETHLPSYLVSADPIACTKRISFASDLASAVSSASIVQEQGPEDPAFKTIIWSQIEAHAPRDALFWSSTSGIPASAQSQRMQDQKRVLIVHPYNPPYIMPLLEIVPSPETASDVVERTLQYCRRLGRAPVVLRRECTGFVANRLAFALYREACSLVAQGVVSVPDLDTIVQASMGPRWVVAGPFKSYHAGGGPGGLRSFMEKIGGTVQRCWQASEQDCERGNIVVGAEWQDDICRQTDEAYGDVDTADRDATVRKVLGVVRRT
jgi:3-hydroxyacyl-CoA dehydrogenase